MLRAAYTATILDFLSADEDAIIGALTRASEFAVEAMQLSAWEYQIGHLKAHLAYYASSDPDGVLHFEYAIPRMGRRIDTLVLLHGVLFVLEYKVGEAHFERSALDQVEDYALDLKNFHETSHEAAIAPVLIATAASPVVPPTVNESKPDRLLAPLATHADGLPNVFAAVLGAYPSERLVRDDWERGRYQPTPTIIEAATALYAGHKVADISRHDAEAINLSATTAFVEDVIAECRLKGRRTVCFVTGVPGAGKTLVGLNIATRHISPDSDLYSVFLSGNGPLVKILHEALARDRVAQAKHRGEKLKKGVAKSEVKAFIQNVHHFRDEGIRDNRPPTEHVALFDEAQRAWDGEQTSKFMLQKKGLKDFDQSEPAFLISCMNRHPDWAVVVCLVGGGQEIHTGEAGIGGWLEAIRDHYPDWTVCAAPDLSGLEYQAQDLLNELKDQGRARLASELHLPSSVRSFRADTLSAWVKAVLDGDAAEAMRLYDAIRDRYPIALTRNLDEAKAWTRFQARGTERYGLVVSSQAQRLKPYAIDVRSPIDPVHWFLDDKADVRSSYYLEDAATEFHVQGLELDWTTVAWDADFRRSSGSGGEWRHFSFRGSSWQRIRKADRQRYQINAYRVLLTRARQGMVIFVPEGDTKDATRSPTFYDSTYQYLRRTGVPVL